MSNSIAAGWKKSTRSGKAMIKITTNEDIPKGSKLVAWEVKQKKSERSPDFTIFYDTYEKGKYNKVEQKETPVFDNSENVDNNIQDAEVVNEIPESDFGELG